MYKIKRKVKIDGNLRTVQCIVIPEKQMVVARLYGCELDAVQSFVIDTGFAPLCPDRFLMNHCYEATVKCHPDDEFIPEVGCEEACEKLGRNYLKARARKNKMILEFVQSHMTEARYKVKAAH